MRASRLIFAGVVAAGLLAVSLLWVTRDAGRFLAAVSAAPAHAVEPVLVAPMPQAAAPASQAAAPAPPPPAHVHPSPTNLQVLPKNLTGEQVHEIMEGWEGQLGTGCKTCHTENKNDLGPNGRPRLNFADDSKEEKKTARLMYKMTENINANYVSKIDSSGEAVTCGTCHRGHLGPEPFVPAEKPHAH